MRTAPLLATAAAALLLAGCASASTAAGGIYADPVAPTAPADPGPGQGPTSGADGASGAPAADGQVQADSATCILGDWTASNEATAAELAAGTADSSTQMDAPPKADIQGLQRVHIDPTTVTTTFDNLVLHTTVYINGHQLDQTSTIVGTVTQPYTIAGDVITTGPSTVDGVQTTASFTLDGQPLNDPEAASVADELRSMLQVPGSSSTVTCTATTLHQVPLVEDDDVAGLSRELVRQ